MAIKLSPARPDDRYARLYYKMRLETVSSKDEYGEEREYQIGVAYAIPEDAADNQSGWIEFWADDAKACKDSLRRIAGRLYVLGERREKRKTELSDERALEELNEFNRLIVDGLAFRTKAWNLVNSAGEAVDAKPSFENCRAVYGDDDHNLRDVIQDFLKERENFPLRANAS